MTRPIKDGSVHKAAVPPFMQRITGPSANRARFPIARNTIRSRAFGGRAASTQLQICGRVVNVAPVDCRSAAVRRASRSSVEMAMPRWDRGGQHGGLPASNRGSPRKVRSSPSPVRRKISSCPSASSARRRRPPPRSTPTSGSAQRATRRRRSTPVSGSRPPGVRDRRCAALRPVGRSAPRRRAAPGQAAQASRRARARPAAPTRRRIPRGARRRPVARPGCWRSGSPGWQKSFLLRLMRGPPRHHLEQCSS